MDRLSKKIERGKNKMKMKINNKMVRLLDKIEDGMETMETKINYKMVRLLDKIEDGMETMETKIKDGMETMETKINYEMVRLLDKIEDGMETMETKINYEMVRLSNETKNGMARKGLLINGRIDREKLQPGDHIFSNRMIGSYSHHGIYVEEDRVIHFTRRRQHDPNCKPLIGCEPLGKACKFQENHYGVIKTCLRCFLKEDDPLAGNSPHLYLYGVSREWVVMRKRGTCSYLPSKPPHEVVETATIMLKNNAFGKYDLFSNNCESFATHCKTGRRLSSQVTTMAIYLGFYGTVCALPILKAIAVKSVAAACFKAAVIVLLC